MLSIRVVCAEPLFALLQQGEVEIDDFVDEPLTGCQSGGMIASDFDIVAIDQALTVAYTTVAHMNLRHNWWTQYARDQIYRRCRFASASGYLHVRQEVRCRF